MSELGTIAIGAGERLVLLVRHAAHGDLGRILTGRGPDGGLEPAGRAEAEVLARQLASLAPLVVHTSPRRRAVETALAIARAAGVGLRVLPALDELDYGDWTGHAFEELARFPLWHAWNARRGSTRPPAGESISEVRERVHRHMTTAAESLAAGATLVMVSHAEVIRTMVLKARRIAVDNWAEIEVKPASVVPFAVSGTRVRLCEPRRRPSIASGALSAAEGRP